MLCKSIDVRERYQRRLYGNCREIPDLDFERSLDYDETKAIHNAWKNDVSDWMSADCLQTYNDLLTQAEELDKQKKKGKGKEKPPKGMEKGSTAKPAEVWISPRQKAQNLKKSRFNKVISDLARNKAFFFAFVRHPAARTAQGILTALETLIASKQSEEYKKMVESSKKKMRSSGRSSGGGI